MLRKIFFGSIVMFWASGTGTQIVIAMFAAFAFLILHLKTEAYKDKSDSHLQVCPLLSPPPLTCSSSLLFHLPLTSSHLLLSPPLPSSHLLSPPLTTYSLLLSPPLTTYSLLLSPPLTSSCLRLPSLQTLSMTAIFLTLWIGLLQKTGILDELKGGKCPQDSNPRAVAEPQHCLS